MASLERLYEVAAWARELTDEEAERARCGITEKTLAANSYLVHHGDRLDAWTGVVSGVVKMSTVTETGKAMSYTGIADGGWFGEGSILKGEPRQYDIVALRETRIAYLNGATFRWLYENSTGFNRFLVRQLNERLGQFIAFLGHDRMLGAPARLARCIAWLFNPVLSPGVGEHLDVSQEELGLLSGMSRQMANRSLKTLEDAGLVRIEHDGITVLDLAGLRYYGE
ncbi:Crp/Fnr family transcriptional regulator [Kaustia mangrovi]|uniref:Crp/Fnr family transcriptional regulator n=1 Tax=Kaustia mangrovi TaxID=2593653 RepID=A0A7S8C2L8_9HYPH|nr:Crp/Fnr family transcriptional regulator [Kaustia mangrovi]QPC42218.1 Crp/Fnr family transcriptional regulator [Kaustia mangrovi]